MEFRAGDLVHIPAETTVFRKRKDGSFSSLTRLNKPSLGLIKERDFYPYYVVIVENISWNIHKSDLYLPAEEKESDSSNPDCNTSSSN